MKTEDAYSKVFDLLNGQDNTFHWFRLVIESNGEEFTTNPLGYSRTLHVLKQGEIPGLVRVEHKYLLETIYSEL